MSLGLAGSSVQRVLVDVLTLAESAYQRAALSDADCGYGWFGLARLKWLTAHFREALAILVGPSPAADLQACQLPLSLAVKTAGGKLSFTSTGQSAWKGPSAGAIMVSHSNDDLALDFHDGAVQFGRCTVSGLSMVDSNLLADFFQKYRPDMFQSAGIRSFEEWLKLVRVPNLGRRAVFADAIRGSTEFALLAACVYLGVPDVLGLPPGSASKLRSPELLEENVVTALDWESQ